MIFPRDAVTYEEAYARYVTEKLPMNSIGKLWNLSPDHARKVIRRLGIPARPKAGLPSGHHARPRIKNVDITPRQMQILMGTILGDGYISIDRRWKTGHGYSNSHVQVTHSSKQLEYANWLHGELNPFVTPISFYHAPDGISCRFCTNSLNVFTELRSKWYPKDEKIFLRGNVEDMDALGLAVWYMDDGTHGVSKGSEYGFLCTDSFSYAEQQEIQSFLKEKFDLDTTIVRTNKVLWRIRFGVKAFKRLRELIAPYVIPSMMYKLG